MHGGRAILQHTHKEDRVPLAILGGGALLQLGMKPVCKVSLRSYSSVCETSLNPLPGLWIPKESASNHAYKHIQNGLQKMSMIMITQPIRTWRWAVCSCFMGMYTILHIHVVLIL